MIWETEEDIGNYELKEEAEDRKGWKRQLITRT
jgi:hypothetical protein